MTRARQTWLATVVALMALTAAAALAAAGEHEAIHTKKVHIQKIAHDCEGDECDDLENERRVIVIDTDGEAHGRGGHAFKWVGHHGGHAFAMARHGKGGFLGVSTTELTPELRRHFGVPEDAGVLVAKVADDSAAALAGIQVGDILTAVDGDEVSSTGELIRAVAGREPGSPVNLELWRDGRLETLGATLGERASPAGHAMVMHCGDEEDCPEIAALGDLGCGGDSPCEIRVECEEAGCECTVNGESAECETLPGFEAPGD